MRVVVLGATGMLGSAVYLHFRYGPGAGTEVVGTTRGLSGAPHESQLVHYDPIYNDRSIQRFVREGDVVVNCIGAIVQKPVRASDMVYLNSYLPHLIAEECRGVRAKLIHISTDCVFEGSDGPYSEGDEITAKDLYGRSKALGEPGGCLVIRTSVIGRHPVSDAGLVEWFLSRRGRVDGYTNHLWNGVTANELARAIETVVRGGLYVDGVRHVHSDDVTKFDILIALKRRYGTESVVVPVPGPELRDRRLRTLHREFLGPLAVRPFREMIASLP